VQAWSRRGRPVAKARAQALPFRSICCLAVGLGGIVSGSGGGIASGGAGIASGGGGGIASGGGGSVGDVVVGDSVVGADEGCPDRRASATASAARMPTAATTSKVKLAFLCTLRRCEDAHVDRNRWNPAP
jgi:hypothetical protein